jgi:hypothetical protein
MSDEKDHRQKEEEFVIDLTTNAADCDWIRAARLKRKGTPEALAELERMKNTPMFKIDLNKDIK